MNINNFIPLKTQRKLSRILGYSIRNLSIPLSNIVISLLVIRFTSTQFWGEFVYYLIVVNLAAHIMAWGNVGYLFREFSRTPAQMVEKWQTNLFSRSAFLVLFGVIILFLPISSTIKLLVFLWTLITFFYRSFDIFIFYRRLYKFSIAVEIGGTLLFILSLLLLRDDLSLQWLIKIYGAITLVKLLMVALSLREVFFPWRASSKFDVQMLLKSLPFFLPAFVGILQTKTDLYCVAFFLSAKDTGEYQVLTNLLLNLQGMASFILGPYIKNIYRLPDATLRKLMIAMFRGGVLLSIPALLAIYVIISKYYQIDFSGDIYLIGYFFVIPFFLYLVKLYQYFKHDQQKVIVILTIAGSILNLALNIALINLLGIKGALLASTITQWVMLILFFKFEHLGNYAAAKS